MTFKNLEKINNLINYLESHNKNYNKTQYFYITEIKDIINADYKKRKENEIKKWTIEDTDLLKSWSYTLEDIEQIKQARKYLKLKDEKGKKISIQNAIIILGRETFLSGLSRASFHFTSVRDNGHGYKIYFDCSLMFE